MSGVKVDVQHHVIYTGERATQDGYQLDCACRKSRCVRFIAQINRPSHSVRMRIQTKMRRRERTNQKT